jgi:hypothetical protein
MAGVGKPLIERFWAKVEITPSCWLWHGIVRSKTCPYGVIQVGGLHSSMLLAHRLSYELMVGPIPEGLFLDHLCRNKLCVNPEHLEPVTNRENQMRGVGFVATNARKTHCVNGHEFTPDNIYRHPQRGSRLCRKCIDIRKAKRIAAKKVS